MTSNHTLKLDAKAAEITARKEFSISPDEPLPLPWNWEQIVGDHWAALMKADAIHREAVDTTQFLNWAVESTLSGQVDEWQAEVEQAQPKPVKQRLWGKR